MTEQKEWSIVNRYNSFNSFKGLTYFEHYQKISGWMKGKNPLPAPILASLDPVNSCNQKCYYCNSQRYLNHLKQWEREFIKSLLNNLSEWGVKSVCWAGGGEPTLNPNLIGMFQMAKDLGLESSIITNGTYLTDEMNLCRWIGISLDSADPDVYRRVRGSDDCWNVLANIGILAKSNPKTDIAVKVLVLPETIDTLLETCKVAKSLGVRDFHVRPVDLERKDFRNTKQINFDMSKIETVFEECHKLETKDFHVYTVTHKYDQNFHVKHDFRQCLASPLVAMICTDKKYYICPDHRLEPRFEIKDWGSDQHRELINSINVEKECSRCTWSEYNRQIEEVILEDKICRNFP